VYVAEVSVQRQIRSDKQGYSGIYVGAEAAGDGK